MTERRNPWIDSSTLSAGVVLVIALIAMVNYFSWKYYQRFDWTSEDLYTLSDKSKNVVAALETPIEAVVFLSPGEPLFDPVRELLSRYAAASPNFSLRVVDPEKNLVEAQALVSKFGISDLDVIVFDRGDDRRVIEGVDLAEYDYSGLQAGRGPEMIGFKGEQVFTGVLIDLAEGRKPKIVFTTGHGELGLDDRSARGLSELDVLLGQDNFDLEEWAPLAEPRVPDGADAVVIAGPSAGFAEPEVRAIEAFVDGGGRLLVLLDPIFDTAGAITASGLEEFLLRSGVEVGADIVIDPERPIPFFGAESFFVDSFGDHPVTAPLRQSGIPVIVPLAQSIEATADGPGVTVLLRTSSAGWGERDLENLTDVSRGESDLPGPVPIAVAIETERQSAEPDASPDDPEGDSAEEVAEDFVDGPVAGVPAIGESPLEPASPPGGTRLAVFGDADFLTNGQLRNVGNAELAVNTINWLVARENLIAIPAKKPEQVRLSLTAKQVRSIGFLVFLILPGLAIVAGAAVFSRRRR